MTLTATRDDDTGFLAGLFTSKKPAIDPTALVNTALKGFKEAADNLVAAQGIIATQKEQHEQEIASLQAKAQECDEQSDRLSRIKDRLEEFLS